MAERVRLERKRGFIGKPKRKENFPSVRGGALALMMVANQTKRASMEERRKKMNENEKKYTQEIYGMFNQLGAADQEHLLWLLQGILFASKERDARA